MLRSHICVPIVALVAILTPTLSAEDQSNEFDAEQRNCCFRGAPLNECRSFFLTETGLRFNFNRRWSEDAGALTLDLGWMKNIGASRAVGFTLYQAVDGDAYRFGIRPRYRQWLNRNFAVDLSAGMLVYINEADWFESTDGPSQAASSTGLVASLSMTMFDIVGITLHYERFTVTYYQSGFALQEAGLPFRRDRDDWYFGLNAGSYPGVPLVAAGSILGVLALYEAISD